VQKITITQAAGSDVQLTANLSSIAVPDGGSTFASLGTALLGVAGVGRIAARRRRA
jgi:MYXO-CTERM domain-containing protein